MIDGIMKQKDRTMINVDFFIRIHVHDDSCIVSAKFHEHTANDIREICRVKVLSLYFVSACMIRFTKSGIENKKGIDCFTTEISGCHICNESTLAAIRERAIR